MRWVGQGTQACLAMNGSTRCTPITRCQHRKSILWSRVLLGFHGGVLLISALTGQWVLVLILSCPSFIANWLSYAVGLTQHCGLRSEVADFRKNTRSVLLPRPVAFLYWHMNWHIEHHMYAGVPLLQPAQAP